MPDLTLGQTDIPLSRVAFGAMSLGYTRDDQEAYDTRGRLAVRRAFEAGITFFDTADVYGNGKSETQLGLAIREHDIPRDRIAIASKCAILFPGFRKDQTGYTYKAYDARPDYLQRSCEESLERLGTDYLDLYQIHRIDYLTHPQETARGLDRLKEQGKVRAAGVSNYTADEVRALGAYTRLESLQVEFSLLHTPPLEGVAGGGLLPICHERNMAMLAWSPLGKGLLAGTGGDDTKAHRDWATQRKLGIVSQLRPFARQYDCTPGQLAVAWLLHLPGPVVPLVGTANPEHIEEAARAVDIGLARDDWYELYTIARGRSLPYSQPPYAYLRET